MTVRVRNAHSATVCDLAPGDAGEVDEKLSGVQVLLRAGLLVEVLPPAPVEASVAVPMADDAEPGPPVDGKPAPKARAKREG